MQKRTALTLLAVALLFCVLAAALYLRWKAPPQVARLLPESDAIVYLNLKPLRAATHFDRRPVQPSGSYRSFMEATGVMPERDLDAVALAFHRLADSGGPNGPVGFSWVLQGRFDSARLTRYLTGIAASRETYAGTVVYSIPSEGRTVRIAVLGSDTVAGSNMPTEEQIHSTLDRRRAVLSPFAGSSVLIAWYGEVPALSSAWAIGKIGLPFAEHGRITLMGLELPLSQETDFVATLGVSPLHPGGLAMRVDEMAGDEAAAAKSVEAMNGLLGLIRSLERAQQTPELKQFTDTIVIKQGKGRATLTATIPVEALKDLAKR